MSAGAGWTTISDPSGDNYLSEYKTVSSTQTGLAATLSSGGNTIGTEIVDAVVAGDYYDYNWPHSIIDRRIALSGDLDAGKTVTLTMNLTEAVTVAGGTPTLTLNDGGSATYTGGSGTSALTFSYTVGAGQNTSALTATAVDLNARHHHGRVRQCRQPVALQPDPERPADRRHRAGRPGDHE